MKKLPSGGYEVGHSSQVIGFDRTSGVVLWTPETPVADLQHDFGLLVEKPGDRRRRSSGRSSAVTPWLSTGARVVLGVVLLVAGAAKIVDPQASVAAVRAYELLPDGVATGVGWGLPFVEVALGVLLLAGIAVRPAALATAALLAVFVVAVASAAARGLSIDCGCFGGGGPVSPGQTAYARRDRARRRAAGRCGMAGRPSAEPAQPGAGPVSRAEQAAARRRERWVLLAVLAALVVVVVAGGIGLQAWRTGRAPEPGRGRRAVVAAGHDHRGPAGDLRGGGRAEVVTVFADFHCPHRAEFDESYGPVLDSARQAGRIRLEVYPMAFIDAGSTAAANAFGCAAEAGFAPGYYAGLFRNPILRWSDDQLLALPEAVGATSTPAFAACVTGRTHAGWVDSINAAAEQRGVTATPTVLVDGVAVDVSELTPDDLAAMINP